MGILRLLLALGVVRAHRPFFENILFIQGGTAVIFFYVISGFYMSLVIAEKYQPSGAGWEWRFLRQRALRLVPGYWIVLAISVIVYSALGKSTVFSGVLDMDPQHRLWTIAANVLMVGMDMLVSLDFVLYQENAALLVNKLQSHFPVLTAWTTTVEFTFYAFAAAFALRDRRCALVALAIGVYIRLYFHILNAKFWSLTRDGIGYSNSPWGYHYFPNALLFFMLGWVSYVLYRRLADAAARDPRVHRGAQGLAAVLAGALILQSWRFDAFQTIADYGDYRIWQTLPIVVALLPPLFLVTRSSAFDMFVGYFSYPIYLCHLIASDAATGLLGFAPSPFTTFVSVGVMSFALVMLVERPIDAWRHRAAKWPNGRRVAA